MPLNLSYPAPAALIEHCARSRLPRTTPAPSPGTLDVSDVAAMVKWLHERHEFDSYEPWISLGMALKVSLGDAGLAVWEMARTNATDETIQSKWESFAADAGANSVTLMTWTKRAHSLGWKGKIRTPTSSMFGTVAALAQASGATLSSGGMPLLPAQQVVVELGQDILDQFLSGTAPVAALPARQHPALPPNLSDHPLYDLFEQAIPRIVAMAEGGKAFRLDRCIQPLKVLHQVHQATFESLIQYISALGGVISRGKLDSAIKSFEADVRRGCNTQNGFIADAKGHPDPNVSDNVHVFVRQRGINLRYNVWKDQPEWRDGDAGTFHQLTDHAFGDLFMDAKSSDFNYHPGKELFRTGLISNARRTLYDPLVERIEALASRWDGKPRLNTWIPRVCGVPCTPYHQAVGRNLIGGMVRRARHPGCRQAETVIFINPKQGTGKSDLTKVLALEPEWHTDSFKFEGSPQNQIPQLFGKWVIELSELAGMAQKDVEHIKSFLSATADNFTRKYEAFATDHPRRCVFIGTSNDRRPLQDVTGNRRFLPVQIEGEADIAWLRENVEQIIGEAAALEAAGTDFSIPREIWDVAAKHQEEARSRTPVEDLCYQWFDRPGPCFILSTDLARALKLAGQNSHARYGAFMDKLGWRSESVTLPNESRKCRVWMKGGTNSPADCVRLEPAQSMQNSPVEMRMRR